MVVGSFFIVGVSVVFVGIVFVDVDDDVVGEADPDAVLCFRLLIVPSCSVAFDLDEVKCNGNNLKTFCSTGLLQPELDGSDQHFQDTVHFPLTSAVDKPLQH